MKVAIPLVKWVPASLTTMASAFVIDGSTKEKYIDKVWQEQYKPKFNNVYLRSNLPRVKDRTDVINFHYKQCKGTYWYFTICWQKHSSLFLYFWNWIYFSRILNKTKDKSITYNIFRIQSDNSITCWFCFVVFIECMIARKNFLDYTNLFSPNDHGRNDKIICNYFKDKYDQRKPKPWLYNKKNRWNDKLSFRRNKTYNLMSENH